MKRFNQKKYKNVRGVHTFVRYSKLIFDIFWALCVLEIGFEIHFKKKTHFEKPNLHLAAGFSAAV